MYQRRTLFCGTLVISLLSASSGSKSKNKTVAELALQGMTQQEGVSTHRIGKDVPEQLKGILPTIDWGE